VINFVFNAELLTLQIVEYIVVWQRTSVLFINGAFECRMLLPQRLDAIPLRHIVPPGGHHDGEKVTQERSVGQRYAAPMTKICQQRAFHRVAMIEISEIPRIIVGISGASGTIYGVRLLELLQPLRVESHLVISRSAEVTLALETDLKPATVRARADVVHGVGDLAAPISSGSFKTIGMVVAPCSIRSMSEIASGVTTTLLTRAADVVLKEQRRLVLLVRETPLHTGHLRTMTALSEMGAIIAPPVPAFYAKPTTIADIVDQTLGRVLDLFGFDCPSVKRWGEPATAC
jgi:flavin prenyltransferase